MRILLTVLVTTAISAPATGAESGAIAQLLSNYEAAGAGPFDVNRGRALWVKAGQPNRSCASCHGEDLTQPGQHVRTRKPIEAMAPSTTPQRLTEVKKVKKWLYRNCKWTWGRECTAQEKGDFLTFIGQQ